MMASMCEYDGCLLYPQSPTPAQETQPTDVEQDGYCPLSTFSVFLLSTCQLDSFMGTPTFEYSRKSAKTLPVLLGEQMVAKTWRTLTVDCAHPGLPPQVVFLVR